ncbi:hypothetical protein ANCCEY_13742 [Ancylostoma ceylanicum]|uniref:Uncharacterized protein n=1 Tax=Ancylostoma ceylanicum TaxID=53326 RepID=A0A0D6L696_9BILA|nr:hypothetical protein ANCCEY_13742 [Ancylostoma ceylanicum]
MMNELAPELGRRKRAAWGAYKSIEDVVKKTKNTRLRAHFFNTTILIRPRTCATNQCNRGTFPVFLSEVDGYPLSAVVVPVEGFEAGKLCYYLRAKSILLRTVRGPYPYRGMDLTKINQPGIIVSFHAQEETKL